MTSFQPLVTIITPSYNQGQFIEATINSVLAQTYHNIEYIVIDALSTDNTASVIDKYRSRITCVIQEADNGQSDAIVKGFKLAKGDLVGWINSDDLLYPDCVAKLVSSYEKNKNAVLFYDPDIDIISENGTLIKCMNVSVVSGAALLKQSNTLVQPGSFYSSSALKSINYFDTDLRYSMDLDLWLRLLKIGGCVSFGNGAVAAYREWDGTKTSTGNAKLLSERKRLLLKHGANFFDKTILNINLNLFKFTLKRYLPIEYILNVFIKVRLAFFLVIYYGLLSHLPPSSNKYTKWTRYLRRVICSNIFRSSGSNINVESGAFFGTGRKLSIGNNSGIGVGCKVFGDVTIGDNVMIGPEVIFITTTHDSHRTDIPMVNQGFKDERPIIVCDDVWIGTRSIILPGIILNKGTIVGAGSVVTKSFPEFSIIAGNPAKFVRSRSISLKLLSD